MGSPLAPIIADIFMDSFEEEILGSGCPLVEKVEYWLRYVDDVLCLWKGTETELSDFLAFINSLHSTIQFPLEVGGHEINFLDLTINIST